MHKRCFLFLLLLSLFCNHVNASPFQQHKLPAQPQYKDTAFLQPYSIKYEIDHSKDSETIFLSKVLCDRNGVVQVLSSKGLLTRSGGQFLYPGKLVQDVSYRPMLDMNLKDMALYQNQFVYASDKAIVSNAWAGKLNSPHTMPDVTTFCGGDDFSFLLTDGTSIQYIKDSKLLSASKPDDKVIDILFDKKRNLFWLLGEHSVSVFDAKDKSLHTKFNGDSLTSFALANRNDELIVFSQAVKKEDWLKAMETIRNFDLI